MSGRGRRIFTLRSLSSTEEILAQIDSLQAEFREMQSRAQHDDLSGTGVPREEVEALRIRVRAAVDRVVPPGTTYAREAEIAAERGEKRGAWAGGILKALYMPLLDALRVDIEKGYVRRLEEAAREAVYDDFLEMATDILGIHPAPAAVVAGSVLEEHLRRLADANGITLVNSRGKPRKFEELGHDLVKDGTISESQRKVLAAWYGQRTEAAHGRWENVIADDVPRMIDGIRDFMVRYPS